MKQISLEILVDLWIFSFPEYEFLELCMFVCVCAHVRVCVYLTSAWIVGNILVIINI
jgi:hypothetical protein